MNIDTDCTKLRPLNEYAKRIPSSRPGKKLNRTTLWRWTLKGCRGVKLHTYVVGGWRFTTDADVMRFIKELSMEPSRPTSGKRPSKQAQKEQERILKRFGAKLQADSMATDQTGTRSKQGPRS